MEDWKIITDFPLYSVSNLGNIKHNKSNKLRTLSNKLDGYIGITLKKDKV